MRCLPLRLRRFRDLWPVDLGPRARRRGRCGADVQLAARSGARQRSGQRDDGRLRV